MRKAPLILILLLVICFSLVAWLEPRYQARVNQGRPNDNVLADLLGDGRKMVADYFYVQADVYFHSGYYPSVFDRARVQEEQDNDVAHPEEGHAHAGHDHLAHPEENQKEEEDTGFVGKPLDWIDRFSRHFRPMVHTHLYGDQLREILPWLKLATELNPDRVQTYAVTAYWLRAKLNKPDEAEEFLREGLKQNPHSPDLLYALGQLYLENRHDYLRARNVFLAALRCWREIEGPKPVKTETGEGQRNDLLLEQILGGLERTEEESGHLEKAIEYMKALQKISPYPEEVQKQIDKLKVQLVDKTTKTLQPSTFWQHPFSTNATPLMKR